MGKFFLFSVVVFLLLIPKAVHAQEFSTRVKAKYQITPSGITNVTHEITLTNLFSTIHAISYSFVIEGIKPLNIKTIEDGAEIPTDITVNNNQYQIAINFARAVVGKGKSRTFSIEYQDDKTAIKNGQVWEIAIPKIQNIDSYEDFSLSVVIPKNFGSPAYLSPQPTDKNATETEFIYFYGGEQLAKAGIVAAFGQFQVFNFRLLYHLINPLDTTGITDVAFPPDTAFQRVYYESIEPKPDSLVLDKDGNWLGTYLLKKGEKIDIEAKGSVQVFASPQNFFSKLPIDRQSYLVPSKYWQTDNPEIIELARQLKTPRAIYDYIVQNLKYDYSRVRENVERLGATKVLVNPNSAICMEFTDLFVALARSAGIPAREINGFAYTDNPELQPLSLVADVLHAWPEYLDEKTQTWIPVDPTWGNTTGGVDYFSKFDLSHITFVIHGQDPTTPLPAGSYKLAENPQKDVNVYFGKLPEKRTSATALNVQIEPRLVPFVPFKGQLIVENGGPLAVYNLNVENEVFDGTIKILNKNIPFLAPFTKEFVPFIWNVPIFSQNSSALFIAGTAEVSYTIPREYLVWEISGIFIILIFVAVLLLSPLILQKKIIPSVLIFSKNLIVKFKSYGNKKNQTGNQKPT